MSELAALASVPKRLVAAPDPKETRLPSYDTSGSPKIAALAFCPAEFTEIKSTAPVTRSLRKTSLPRSVSRGLRFFAVDVNTTYRPLPEMANWTFPTSSVSTGPSAATPAALVDAGTVVPATRSRTKSCGTIPAVKATKRPSAETAAESAGTPAEAGETSVVSPGAPSASPAPRAATAAEARIREGARRIRTILSAAAGSCNPRGSRVRSLSAGR